MRTLPRSAAFAAGAIATAVLLPTYSASASHADHEHGRSILRAPLAGSIQSDPQLFGATRGNAPWTTRGSTVRLTSTGRLDVDVRGLIIPTQGSNPVPALSASVACNGMVVASTPSVPFSTAGDARIRATVMLPDRCLAPAVLINPNTNALVYIAATGTE